MVFHLTCTWTVLRVVVFKLRHCMRREVSPGLSNACQSLITRWKTGRKMWKLNDIEWYWVAQRQPTCEQPLLCLMVTADSCTVTTKSGSAAQYRDLIFINSLMKYSNRGFYHSTMWPVFLPPSLSVFLWSLCSIFFPNLSVSKPFFFWHLIILGSDLNSTMQCLCWWLHVKEPFVRPTRCSSLISVYLSVSMCCLPLSVPSPPAPSVLRVPSCRWEVWSRQSCYERLWKVEVAALTSLKRKKNNTKKPKGVAHVMTVDIPRGGNCVILQQLHPNKSMESQEGQN